MLTSMLIRRERPDDGPAVRAVHQAAFDRPELAGATAPEAQLVDELRSAGDTVAALALVGEHEGRVVDHVVCSRAPRPTRGVQLPAALQLQIAKRCAISVMPAGYSESADR